jgi:hypothetical protein
VDDAALAILDKQEIAKRWRPNSLLDLRRIARVIF